MVELIFVDLLLLIILSFLFSNNIVDLKGKPLKFSITFRKDFCFNLNNLLHI